jgi:hypothetical protein
VSKEQLEQWGLVTAPEPESVTQGSEWPRPVPRSRRQGSWPDYARSLADAPPNHDGSGTDRRMADFTWCMTAIDWGWSIEDTAAKLTEVSEKARERIQLRDKDYPLITAQNAAAAVERNDRKRGNR